MKILIAIAILALICISSLFFLSSDTALKIDPPVQVVGASTPVTVQTTGPHGVRRVSAFIEQGGAKMPLLDQSTPSHHLFWRKNQPPQTVTFDAGRGKAPNLKEGDAKLVVEAVTDDFRGSTATASLPVKVVLAPPRVVGDEYQHYVNQGGMELAVMTPSGSWTDSGVKVGDHRFRSFPLPGQPGQRFAMFAYPWDQAVEVAPLVYARNAAGNEATAAVWFKLFPKKFRVRDFELKDEDMARLVSQIDPNGTLAPGPDMLTRFLKINGDLRRKNNQQLADLRLKTEEKVLWNGPFLHWGKEESYFADVRNYIYKGKQVDRQVHLGFDLSDTQNAPVHVANDGRVVYAGDLGIYGNCVVVDHGYSLQSIYGHLNRIDVKVGDMVKKDQSLGMAGSTGLALGVHVHFSMQIDGVQVNAREWWDDHWIHDRIMSKLSPGAAVPTQAVLVTSHPGAAHRRKKH